MPSDSSRSRSRSRSRRRSRSRDSHRRSRRSRSRSHGGHASHRRRSKSFSRSMSRSPLSNRKRHIGTRDNPPVSKCLGIFGLSTRTTEADLRDVFDRYPGFVGVRLICDYGTGTSRGFGFLSFESVDDARYVKDKCVGMDIDGRSIRIDFSTTTRAHTPTPGRYMGRPSYRPRYSGRDREYGGRSSRYERRRHSRSYSRSPRRY